MRQRFRLYFTLWLWTLTGIGVMFFVSPEGKNPVQAKDPWIFAALFLCGIYDVWRRVRRVSLHSGAGLLELRRGAEVVLQTPWSEVALWSPFQNLRLLIQAMAITVIGMVPALIYLFSNALERWSVALLVACILFMAAAIYDWRVLQTIRMPDQRDITLTRTEINSLLAAASRRMN